MQDNQLLQSVSFWLGVFATPFLVTPASLAQVQPFPENEGVHIGWASADITPQEPVAISGQFHARVSEGILDPITATALVIESVTQGQTPSRVVMISCDLISISDELRDATRARLREMLPELDPMSVFLAATHTHAAPQVAIGPRYVPAEADVDPKPSRYGVDLPVMDPADYVNFAADRIAQAIVQAWQQRQPAGVAYGLGQALVGENRLIVNHDGKSTLYGDTTSSEFSHTEGTVDHSVHLLFTWNRDRKLTGVVVNLACPSQVDEFSYLISADFWHETRQELRRRFGENIFVLPLVRPAGDQVPRSQLYWNAEKRMQHLYGRTLRQEIAFRIAETVSAVMPAVEKDIAWNPVLIHHVVTVPLPRRIITEQDAEEATQKSAKHQAAFDQMMAELAQNPEKRQEKRWYRDVTRTYRQAIRGKSVVERLKYQAMDPNVHVEMHVLRLGDVAFATNPFELYLDFGLQMQTRSPAMQTFLVQLVGPGTYVPTERGVAGGGYGAVPASTGVGPEGGRVLVNWTVDALNALWQE